MKGCCAVRVVEVEREGTHQSCVIADAAATTASYQMCEVQAEESRGEERATLKKATGETFAILLYLVVVGIP